LVTRFRPVSRLDRPGVEGVAQVDTLLAREGEGHSVWVDVDANDGYDRPKHLFLEFVRDRQLVPELQEEGLVAGEGPRVRFIKKEVILPVETGGVVSVGGEVFDPALVLRDPSDETVEGDEDGGGARATEGGVSVYVTQTVNSVYLLQLPKEVKGHEAMSLRDIRFPGDELVDSMRTVEEGEEHLAQMGHVVEGEAGYFVVVDHAVEREGACTMIRDHTKVGRVGFGDGMGRHRVHAREEVWPEGRRETSLLDLDVALLADERRLACITGGRPGSVECCWVAVFERVRPGPEALSQASTHGGDKEGVRVVGEQFLEAVHIDWGDDAKKGGVVGDCLKGDGIRGFREGRTRKGGGGCRPFGNGGSG